MNVKYASDPYWGEKQHNYYLIDKDLGMKDYNYYTIAIKQIPNAVNLRKGHNYIYSNSQLFIKGRCNKYSVVLIGKLQVIVIKEIQNGIELCQIHF